LQQGALGRLYHGYNLMIANPVPDLQNFTGVIGFALSVFLPLWALWRRRWADLAATAALVLLNLAFFATELNYRLLSFLTVL
jgi:uncharacterized membrane protein YhaH (DUF805 family)